jgi:hypothetical protein
MGTEVEGRVFLKHQHSNSSRQYSTIAEVENGKCHRQDLLAVGSLHRASSSKASNVFPTGRLQ